VILLGHSSGSMVVTGVAERAPERLSRIVYLDTIIPADGQSWFDLLGHEATKFLLELAQTRGDGWRIPFPFAPPDAEWVPYHPLATVTQPLTVGNPATAALPRTFIFCTGKGDDWFCGIGGKIAEAARQARAAGWDYRELMTGHSPHLERPEEFSALLLQLV
jgi:pimeloyl-ACP methyl ester carboxylesterase